MKFFAKLTPNETVFGFIYFLLQLLAVPGILVAVSFLLPYPVSEAILNALFFAINFVVVLVLFRKFLTANFQIVRGYPWHVLRISAIGFVGYMVLNAVFSLITTLLVPDFANINDAAIMEMVQDHYGLMTVSTVLLVPVAEECFYRGLIFRNLYNRNPFLAYGVSMAVFALAHVAAYVTMVDFQTIVLCFLQYLPAGFALAWSYRRSGTIFAPVLIHMAVNQTGMLFMR